MVSVWGLRPRHPDYRCQHCYLCVRWDDFSAENQVQVRLDELAVLPK